MPSHPSPNIFDALILGGGPAGLSTALSLARVHRTALVLSHQSFRNDGVQEMHAIPSRDGMNPEEFRRISREQIQAYGDGIEFVDGEAVRLAKKVFPNGYHGFEIEDEGGTVWIGRKLVLAMGSRDVFPNINGYAENWGQNIYQCLFCHGHERSHLPIGILRFLPSVHLKLALMACHISGPSPKVTIFTDGELPEQASVQGAIQVAQARGCVIETRSIFRLVPANGGELGVDIMFVDGNKQRVGFILDKPHSDLVGRRMIKSLGVEYAKDVAQSRIVKRTEPYGETSVQGVFVVGDAGVQVKHVTNAGYTGIAAAGGVSMQLVTEEGERSLAKVKGLKVEDVKLDVGETT